MKDNYTVLLLYPDYMSDQYGHDTYLAHVHAAYVDSAIKAAQKQAVRAQAPMDRKGVNHEDFHPLFVCKGEVEDERSYP